MAGFDFEFSYTDTQEPIVHVCLTSAKARARQLRLRWRTQTLGVGQLRVTIDGNSRRMDLLGYRLERDLPLVAEGCNGTTLQRVQRQRLGRGFADLLLRGRHSDHEGRMELRGVSETRWYYPPYEYSCADYPRLHARLRITEDVLVGWHFDEVAAEVLLEELHTACELVLEETVNRRSKRMSFAELVDAAATSGRLNRYEDDEADPVELLIALKDLRKSVRHRAADGAEAWMSTHDEPVAIVIERLVNKLNRLGPVVDESANSQGSGESSRAYS